MKKIIASRAASIALQLAVMAIASAAAGLLPLLLPELYTPLRVILQWIMLPLLGGVTAGVASRAGVSHYLSWLPPPLIVSAVPWLIVGYPLRPGVMLLCCLISMIGASTGEVLRRRAAQRKE